MAQKTVTTCDGCGFPPSPPNFLNMSRDVRIFVGPHIVTGADICDNCWNTLHRLLEAGLIVRPPTEAEEANLLP